MTLTAKERYSVEGVFCLVGGEELAVVDMSVGGFFVATPRPPLRGVTVAVALQLPGGRAIPVTGRVAWTNEPHQPKTGQRPHGFGLGITRVGLSEKLALVALLRQSRRIPETSV